MRLDGPVRFRFRDLGADIEVLIEGDAAWVEKMREELGISGDGPGYSVMQEEVHLNVLGLLQIHQEFLHQ